VFSAQELVEVRKMVLAAIMLTREDFQKATEDVAASFQVLEDAHKARLAKATEQFDHKIRIAQDGLKDAREKLTAGEAELTKGWENLNLEKTEFKASSLQTEDQLRQQRKQLDDDIRAHSVNAEQLNGRIIAIESREASIAASYEQINNERQAMRDKETQMRALVTS